MLGWAPNTGWDNLPHLEPSALSAWSVSLSYDWQKYREPSAPGHYDDGLQRRRRRLAM